MPSLYSILLFIRALGIRRAASVIRHTRLKARLDHLYETELNFSKDKHPGGLVGFINNKNSLNIVFDQAELEVTFLTPDLVRVTWQPGSVPAAYVLEPKEWSTVQTELLINL